MVVGKVKLSMAFPKSHASPAPPHSSATKSSLKRSFATYFSRSSAQVQPHPSDILDLLRLVKDLCERVSPQNRASRTQAPQRNRHHRYPSSMENDEHSSMRLKVPSEVPMRSTLIKSLKKTTLDHRSVNVKQFEAIVQDCKLEMVESERPRRELGELADSTKEKCRSY